VLKEAGEALLAAGEILKKGEGLHINTLLKRLAIAAPFLAIGMETIDALEKVHDAELSPEAKQMLSGLVISLALMMTAIAAISLFSGPYGIAVTALASAYISMITAVRLK
jgi:hypothetical protein